MKFFQGKTKNALLHSQLRILHFPGLFLVRYSEVGNARKSSSIFANCQKNVPKCNCMNCMYETQEKFFGVKTDFGKMSEWNVMEY